MSDADDTSEMRETCETHLYRVIARLLSRVERTNTSTRPVERWRERYFELVFGVAGALSQNEAAAYARYLIEGTYRDALTHWLHPRHERMASLILIWPEHAEEPAEAVACRYTLDEQYQDTHRTVTETLTPDVIEEILRAYDDDEHHTSPGRRPGWTI